MITFKKLGHLGRFGNQLFQYAGAKMYADINGFKSVFPGWIGNKIFENIAFYNNREYLLSRFLPTRQLNDLTSYTHADKIKYALHLLKQLPQTVELKKLYAHPEDNINLLGYFQDKLSLKILKERKRNVLDWFTFKKDIENEFRKETQSYRPWIGIHIRRGDFVKRGLSLPAFLYKDFLKSADKKNIYISCDDPETISEFKDYPLIRPENPLPQIPNFIFDFWMLKESEMILGCGSTFSWWAAYLGNRNNYFSPPLTHLWPKEYKPTLEKINI